MPFYKKYKPRKSSESDSPEKPKQPAINYCVWLLSRRDYSEYELKERMVRRGYEDCEVTTTLEKLKDYGFQSDERYARSVSVSNSKRKGDRAIEQKLKTAKIAEEIVENSIEQLTPEDQRALEVCRKKFKETELDDKLRSKIWRFLAYRGFSGSSIKYAIKNMETPTDE